MISLTAEYALRAVSYLAENGPTPCTVQEIGAATNVPVDYLSKVLQELARAKMVRSQRGLHGGFRLLKDPTELTAFDVIQAVSPTHRIDRCPMGQDEHADSLCRLHRLIDDSMSHLEAAFRETSIAYLANLGSSQPPPWETAWSKMTGSVPAHSA
jgi:Rrf2 family nitric oxide-sensitive transcriptional repressor